ncbi:MAG TPA: hypothetical protein VIG78_05380 [Gemmatimonadaceae bacterium]|jgi:hypothetical protein
MIRRLSFVFAVAPVLAAAQAPLPAQSSRAPTAVISASTWNRIVEGSSMLGDDVKIEINIAAVEQAP